ncbi:uncharacterized protein LOC126839885 isoform X2 [Adelges cooleyi]|uniref:uncharacterized protein LOC126839885 isoform X2 n=1 Tax=Adelges cooleyi TaxID=133065 RepID=UPI0021808AF5|nr:uncharacterized protein LOC126839885 isoform X2 [Adelges cooleyi]
MVNQCVIRACKIKANKEIIMHGFPKNHEMLFKWKNAIWMFQPDFLPTTHTKICSSHFLESDYNLSYLGKKVLKKDAVPSVFKPVCKTLFNVEMVEVFDDEEGRNLQNMPISGYNIRDDHNYSLINVTEDKTINFDTHDSCKDKEFLPSPQNMQLNSINMNDVDDENIQKCDSCKTVVSESDEEVVPNEPSTSHSLITPYKPKKRKTFVGDFKSFDELESPNSRLKFWHASNNTIKNQQHTIKNLRKQNYCLNKKIKILDQLIRQLKNRKET